MTIAVVLVLVIGLGLCVVVAVARDPGPAPVDVAIAYTSALALGDFDAMYRMTDDAVLKGHNRVRWIDERANRPQPAVVRDAVAARVTDVEGDRAEVVVATDPHGGTALVTLTRRQRVWTVSSFTPSAAASDLDP